MKLLLQRNIEKLGSIGDIVEVPPGYGRNYLLPKGLAVEVTADNINRFEGMKRRLIAIEQETKEKFELLAKEIEGASCTVVTNASEEGHLYGSVTARDIAAQFVAEDIQVEPKSIVLPEPIKELGIYMVNIRLHPEVECEAKVWVVKGDESQVGSMDFLDEEDEAPSDDGDEEAGADELAAEEGADDSTADEATGDDGAESEEGESED
ncbi:MAG: 50S ribosomal protein L9 [Planctomycetota bacterium]|nr:50S ribosomal protein L9 [Planctomycetota bacterium]